MHLLIIIQTISVWQTDSYFTTSLCLDGLLHLVSLKRPPPPTHPHTQPNLHFPHVQRVYHVYDFLWFSLWFSYMTRVEGEHVQDVMRQCWWVEPERGGAGMQKKDRREREMCRWNRKVEKHDESSTWNGSLNKQSHRHWSPETATFDSKCHFKGNKTVALWKEKEVNLKCLKAEMKFQPT